MTNEGYVNETEIFPKVIGTRTGEIKMAYGEHTPVDANDTVVTGLATVVAAIASLGGDPIDTMMNCTCDIGDQAGSPAAGSILLKSWKFTDADSTHIASTTPWTPKINWVAFGY